MELPLETFKWLQGINAVSEYEIKSQDTENVVLDKESTQQFELGFKMQAILGHLYKLKVFFLIS